MTIDYTYLALALLILWFPRQWLRFGRKATRRLRWLRRSRSRLQEQTQTREPGELRLSTKHEFTKPRNYIDFLRALTGGMLLVGNAEWQIGAALHYDADHLLQPNDVDWLMYLRMGLMLVGVVIQFLRFEGRLSFYAPLFYLGGLGFSLAGVNAGFFAFLIGWMLNSAAALTPAGFLFLYSLLVFMLGLLFEGISNWYVLFAGLVSFLPVLVSLLARRSLAVFAKKIK